MEKVICLKKPSIWQGKHGRGVGPSTMEVCTPIRTIDKVWLVLSGYPDHLVYHRQYFRPLDQLDHQLDNIEALGNMEFNDR